MLSNLRKISKTLAAILAAMVLLIAVHGIFMHGEQELKHEVHACVLCEILTTETIFSNVEVPLPFSQWHVVNFNILAFGLVYISIPFVATRGPPVEYSIHIF